MLCYSLCQANHGSQTLPTSQGQTKFSIVKNANHHNTRTKFQGCKDRPVFTGGRRPRGPSFLTDSNSQAHMWLFVIGWFLVPSGIVVWFHPGKCESQVLYDCLNWVVGSRKTSWWEVSPSKLMNELHQKFS